MALRYEMHIGVVAQSGLIHSVQTTAANESDVAHARELLHGQETQVHGDSGYIGLDKRDEITSAQADFKFQDTSTGASR